MLLRKNIRRSSSSPGRWRPFAGVAVLAATIAATSTAPASAAPQDTAAAARTYYVDCSRDGTGNGTLQSPLTSIEAANAVVLQPGESMLFRRGATCLGQFAPQGDGTAQAPITIAGYGPQTKRAVINADGATNAVLMDATAYLRLTELELTAPGDNKTVRRGVYVYGKDAGTVKGVVVRDLYIHDVRGELPAVLDPGNIGSFVGKAANASGGIIVEAQGTQVPTAFDGLVVEKNRIEDVDRQGIYTWSNWCARPELGRWKGSMCFANWFPHTNMTFRDNQLKSIGGDGIVMKGVAGGVIEGNRLDGFNRRSKSNNAGIWMANADDIVVRENIAERGLGTFDSQGYDVDHATHRITVERNISRNNDGGFLLMCPDGTGSSDVTIRNNISINDGTKHVVFHGCGGPVTRGVFENNTIYIGPGLSPKVYDGTRTIDLAIRNNIIVKEGAGSAPFTVPAGMTVDHNAVNGTTPPATATNTVTAPVLLMAGGVPTADGYRLQEGSSALAAGVGTGYTGPDYFGSPTPAQSPNIGAYQGPGLARTVANGCVPDLSATPGSVTTKERAVAVTFTVSNDCGAVMPRWRLSFAASEGLTVGSGTLQLPALRPGQSVNRTVTGTISPELVDARLTLAATLTRAGATVRELTVPITFRDTTGWATTQSETFDAMPVGAPPTGWAVSGTKPPVVADVAGERALRADVAAGTNAAVWTTSPMPETVRVVSRLRATGSDAALGLQLLDAANAPVVRLSLNASGGVSYTDGSSWVDTSVSYPVGEWMTLEAVVTGSTYTVYLDDQLVGQGKVERTGATKVRVQTPSQSRGIGQSFALDEISIQTR